MPPENERLSKQILVPEAGDLMDAHGIRRDFVTAKAEAHYLLSHLANADPIDFLLIQALTTSLIVRYCRPFAKGVRKRQIARDLVGELTSTEGLYHQRNLDWRNKHIAHSVNRDRSPLNNLWRTSINPNCHSERSEESAFPK